MLEAFLCYSKCKRFRLQNYNYYDALEVGFMGKSDRKYQNGNHKLKLLEELAAECACSRKYTF
jgi:hypothetical protein